MKKYLLLIALLFSLAAESQFSVLRAPKYAGTNSLGFIPVSKDSSGYSIVNHLSIQDIITLAAGGSSSTDSTVYSTKAYRQKGVDSVIAVIGARNYLTSYTVDSLTFTTWKRAYKVNDSMIAVNNAKYLQTAVTSEAQGWGATGGTIITTGTRGVDSFSVTSKANRDKLKDSLQANINAKLSSAVTSITPGWGLTPQTAITSTGAPLVDSFSVLSKARGQKQIDSVQANITTLSAVEKRNSLSANATTTAATNTNTNLSFSVAANEVWVVMFDFTAQCSSTGGVKIQISTPASATIEGWYLSSGATITTPVYNRITAINTLTTTITHTVATTPGPDRIWIRVKNSTNAGTISLGFASGTSTQTTTIFAGATMLAFKVTEL